MDLCLQALHLATCQLHCRPHRNRSRLPLQLLRLDSQQRMFQISLCLHGSLLRLILQIRTLHVTRYMWVTCLQMQRKRSCALCLHHRRDSVVCPLEQRTNHPALVPDLRAIITVQCALLSLRMLPTLLLRWQSCTVEHCQDPMEAMAKVVSDFHFPRIHWGCVAQEIQEELQLTSKDPPRTAAPITVLATTGI